MQEIAVRVVVLRSVLVYHWHKYEILADPFLTVLTAGIQYSQQALKFVYYPTFETLFVIISHIKGKFLSMT